MSGICIDGYRYAGTQNKGLQANRRRRQANRRRWGVFQSRELIGKKGWCQNFPRSDYGQNESCLFGARYKHVRRTIGKLRALNTCRSPVKRPAESRSTEPRMYPKNQNPTVGTTASEPHVTSALTVLILRVERHFTGRATFCLNNRSNIFPLTSPEGEPSDQVPFLYRGCVRAPSSSSNFTGPSRWFSRADRQWSRHVLQ